MKGLDPMGVSCCVSRVPLYVFSMFIVQNQIEFNCVTTHKSCCWDCCYFAVFVVDVIVFVVIVSVYIVVVDVVVIIVVLSKLGQQ